MSLIEAQNPSRSLSAANAEPTNTEHINQAGSANDSHGAEEAAANGIKKDEKSAEKQKQPAGGFSDAPLPSQTRGYTLRITFHRATNLPRADLNSLSSDPFVVAELKTDIPPRHKDDPTLKIRTPTVQKSTNPEWNCPWIVANIPASGFRLKARLYDEDPADHDDRLGNAHIVVPRIDESWPGIHEQAYKIKKRMGSKRAYMIRLSAALVIKGLKVNGDLVVSVENLGKTEDASGRTYTIGPCAWSKHFSPLMGRLTGTKDDSDGDEHYNFQATQIQLEGPVPEPLYHRYVEFKSFIKGMFQKTGIRGRILNYALHKQHKRIYNYGKSTIYGSYPSPCKDMTIQFLDMVHYDEGGRLFTYVLSLDALLSFTETGKEFGIDLLSKHTMHSDVSNYIAFSGEFFVRRLAHPEKDADDPQQKKHPSEDIEGGPPRKDPPKEPSHYELTIDNDSGTYRPNAKLLPELQAFLEHNFPGLKITTRPCDDDDLQAMKKAQRETKKKEGENRVFMQGGRSGSFSSSDEERLETAANTGPHRSTREQGLELMTEPVPAIKSLFHAGKDTKGHEGEAAHGDQ
ncbi:MAG: hypothetical protein M1829_003043 [Trizodia sp. TS-e1964]|nr:MAG: hypothetical protein M1829_003043 [Trizodia sp. TS-e1964]